MISRLLLRPLLMVLLAVTLLPSIVAAQDDDPSATPEGTPEATPVASPVASPVGIAQIGSPTPVEPTLEPDLAPSGTPMAAHVMEGVYPGPNAIALVKVADGLESPRVVAAAHDGTGRVFIGQRYGTVRVLTKEGDLLPEPFIDISPLVQSNHQDSGLLGLAFHPDYETNGFFYIAYTDINVNGAVVLAQYQVSPDDPNRADPASAQDILKISHPTPILNGGTIQFGPDGYLYLSVGNGAFFGVHDIFTAQQLDNHLGKILRLEITNENGVAGYRVPANNPYNMSYTYWNAQHVWALGLRNPWGFFFDPETGDMYIPDTGEASWEEINFIPAGSRGGQNFGWPIWEGMHCVNFYTNGACAETGVPPVAEYPHGDYGCAIVGIGVYRGASASFIDGFFLAADYCTGKIWGLSRDAGGGWVFQELLDAYLLIPGGGMGEDGEVYVLSCDCGLGPGKPENNPGTIWKVESASAIPEGTEVAPLN